MPHDQPLLDNLRPDVDAHSPWQRLSSSLVHSTPWFDVRTDSVVRPDGSPAVYQRVVSPGSVTVLAIDDHDQVIMTRQWIYVHDSAQWRLPSGGIDAHDDNPLGAAKRELEEEAGVRALRWASLGRINCADSITNHVDHLFLASGLEQGTAMLEPGEADMEIVHTPFDEAVQLVMSGQVPDAGSAHALILLWARRAGVSHTPMP